MNFYDYIKNDMEEKKALIDVLPHNTEIRKKKFLDIFNETKDAYLSYKKNVSDFILYKYDKLMPVKEEKDLSELDKKINYLEYLLFWGNSYTSYYEKMGFDKIFYDLIHYSNFSLNKINDLLEKCLINYELSGIKIKVDLFNTNVYSYCYMHNFFTLYYKKEVKPKSDPFESIYWMCPNVLEYIIIDLWVLLTNNKSKFEKYAAKKFDEDFKSSGFKSMDELYDSYVKLKLEKENLTDEDEADIVNEALKGSIDITTFDKNSDIRKSDFNFFMINPIDLNNENELNEFYESIYNLRNNFFEYAKYLSIIPLIDYYKKKYETPNENIEDKKAIRENEKAKIKESKEKDKEIQINLKNLYKYKCKLSFDSKTIPDIIASKTKDEIFAQNQVLTTIYGIFKDSLKFYYDGVVKNTLKYNSSISEIIKLVVFFPTFGRDIVKEVFAFEKDEEVDEKMKELFEFIYNPHKKIIDMIPLYVEQNTAAQLLNGFRFENLNLNIDSFEEENHGLIFERTLKILRCKKIDKFKLSIDEIVFLCAVYNLKDSDLI